MGEKLFWVGMNSIFLIMTHILFIFLVFAYYMIHISLMKTTSPLPGPVKVALKKLGADISDARKRRRVPTTLMAERAFISRSTLGRIEKGDPSVSLGNYAAVLFVNLPPSNTTRNGSQIRTDLLLNHSSPWLTALFIPIPGKVYSERLAIPLLTGGGAF